MDASALTSNVLNKKSLKRQKATGGKEIDIISNLPESVLSHILSSLPTKDAVRTSVLSTRWKFMWTSVTNLHFDDQLLYSRKRRTKKSYFMNFVDRVLLHYGNSTIQNFYLSCDKGYDTSRVNAWISTVIRRKVQRLDISYHEESFVFPRALFSCDSLIELNLQMFCTLKFPTICFSNLKILDLCGVQILNEYFSHSKQLLLSFPVLKVFNSLFCTWLNVKIVDIDAPALDSFTLKYSEYKCIHDGSCDIIIKICAPHLTKFECKGYLSEDFILPTPSSIVDVAVEVSNQKAFREQIHEIGFRACMLLRKFTNVKCLTLSPIITKVIGHVKDLEAHLPTFDKLTHLKLFAEDGFGSLIVSGTVMDLLQGSPNLECLIIVGGYNFRWDNDDDLVLERDPQCFLSRLKVVTYQNFYGTEHELCVVKFLLKNLKVLEEMTITFNLVFKWLKKEAKKKLLSFPKASNRASIVFP